jgi:hypothetical protein
MLFKPLEVFWGSETMKPFEEALAKCYVEHPSSGPGCLIVSSSLEPYGMASCSQYWSMSECPCLRVYGQCFIGPAL